MTTFNDFLYDPGSGVPGARVTSFPVQVDGGSKIWELQEDIRPDTGSGRGFFRPPDGRGVSIVVYGERTELNFVGPGYDAVVPNGDEHHFGAIGRFIGPSSVASWNLGGQLRWGNGAPGGHPCWGMEVINGKVFIDVRAYDTPAIGQAAANYPSKPGVTIPFDTEIALYAHVKINRAGGGILHFSYAPAAWDAALGKYKVTGAWVDICNLQNVAVGYLSTSGWAGIFKLFFSHYSTVDKTKRTNYLRRHAAALTRDALDTLMAWEAEAPVVVPDTEDPVLTGLTVGYVQGESVIDFVVNASDNVKVTSVKFELDDVELVTELNPPYTRTDHPLGAPLSAGVHTVKATALDAAGNSSWTTVNVNVGGQQDPPTAEDPRLEVARENFLNVSSQLAACIAESTAVTTQLNGLVAAVSAALQQLGPSPVE